MPPLRNLPTVKPVKTERTHEENQERAYIAASRRSDRSLEARIESARRASEIHKRRTGRSLRVTEQDVVNEEMYEEEDDDLPMQYRRLTAHLNTNSSDFNRRLATYLSNHVAMRTALDQAISSSYNQQQQMQAGQTGDANALFPQNTNNMLNPAQAWTPGQNPQYPSQLSQHMATHRLPNSFRQSPYPTAVGQSYRPTPHSTSSNNSSTPSDIKLDSTTGQNNADASSAMASPAMSGGDSTVKGETEGITVQYPMFLQKNSGAANALSMSPLTTELPREAQMFFGANGTYGTNDLFGNDMFGNSDKQPSFTYNDGPFYNMPYVEGMNQTLAPGVLEQDQMKWSGMDSGYQGGPAFNNIAGANTNHSNGQESFGNALNADGSDFGGLLSPGDNEWSSFIDTANWDET